MSVEIPIELAGRIGERVHHSEIRYGFAVKCDPCFAIVTRDPLISMFDLGMVISELESDWAGVDAQLIAELRMPVLFARQDRDPVVAFLGVHCRFV